MNLDRFFFVHKVIGVFSLQNFNLVFLQMCKQHVLTERQMD